MSGHAPMMRALHWGSAALLAAAYAAAWSADDAAGPAESAALLALHRSLGLAVWAATLLRLASRRRLGVPALPFGLPPWQAAAARASVLLLYALLLLQPLLGLMGSLLHGHPVQVFGLSLPALAADRPLAELLHRVHGATGTLLLGLIGLHAAAALHHHLVRRDAVLAGMLPWCQHAAPLRAAARRLQ